MNEDDEMFYSVGNKFDRPTVTTAPAPKPAPQAENSNANLFRTQQSFEAANAILKQFSDLTPQAREKVMSQIKKTDTDKQLEEAAQSLTSANAIAEAFAGKGMTFEGFGTGLPTLDRYLLGLKGGDVVVMGAYTGIGKSTLSMYLSLYLQKQGVPSCVFALEDGEFEVGTRVAYLKKGHPELFEGHDNECAYIFPNLASSLLYKNKFAFIPAVEAIVIAKGVKVVVVDMLNDILDPITDKDADDFMVELKAMTERLGIILIVTARLREPKALTEKGRKKELLAPNEDAIYGKSMIKYLATKIITLSTNFNHPYEAERGFGAPEVQWVSVHVCKNRVGKTTKKENGAVVLKFMRGRDYMKIEDRGFETFGGGDGTE